MVLKNYFLKPFKGFLLLHNYYKTLLQKKYFRHFLAEAIY